MRKIVVVIGSSIVQRPRNTPNTNIISKNLIFAVPRLNELDNCVCIIMCEVRRQSCCRNPKSCPDIEWADVGQRNYTFNSKRSRLFWITQNCFFVRELNKQQQQTIAHFNTAHNLSFLLVLVNMETVVRRVCTLICMLWHFEMNLHE